jgi:hypothetical protein
MFWDGEEAVSSVEGDGGVVDGVDDEELGAAASPAVTALCHRVR